MKEFILVLLWVGFSLKSIAQKDKTLTWLPAQKGYKEIFVSKQSIKFGEYFYQQYLIVPNQQKTLHLDIFVTYRNGWPLHTPFAIEARSRKQVFFSNVINNGDAFSKANINLTNLDTMAINFIASISNNDTTKFDLNYTVGDTAELDYSNRKPQQVFERMLELCATGYTNIGNAEQQYLSNIKYPKGLFADFKAIRNGLNYDVTQYTSKDIKSEKDASSNYDDWNKKITTWLEDYNINSVKKIKLEEKEKGTSEEITVYTKKNKEGKILFVVEVFKQLNKFNYKEPYFETGVRIAQQRI